MLALMPPSPPITDFHATTPPMTMSLAVLPPTRLAQSPSAATLSFPSSTVSSASQQLSSSSKRPKLKLNTTSLPTSVGKSNTGLRIETASLASPTAKNTFQNAFGSLSAQLHTTTPISRCHAPTPLRTCSSDSFNSSASSNSSTSVESSASSASSTDSISPPVPYRLPYNNKSILTNGPLPRIRTRKSMTGSRPMFPSPKKVSFRTQLTEDIHTVKYTMAHIDTDSSSSSISSLNLPPPSLVLRGQSKALETSQDQDQPQEAKSPSETETKAEVEPSSKQEPQVGDKRESSDEEDSDTCPSTPVTRRNKRRREWVWTLGPLKSEEVASPTIVQEHESYGEQLKDKSS